VVVFAGIFMAFNRGGRLNHLLGPARGLRAGADEASSSGGSSDDSSSSGSSGGDFSGGGGSFGGGGASGSW